jgi:GxxExxY protein
MDTDLFFKEETRQIIGFAMEILNEVGHGLHEKPYENALVVDFKLHKIPYAQQKTFDVFYKETKIGEFIPDLIAFNKIIIDTKTIDQITPHETGQMLNYLKIINLKIGLIINFKHAKLEWRRVAR